jgi:hypothetical protein
MAGDDLLYRRRGLSGFFLLCAVVLAFACSGTSPAQTTDDASDVTAETAAEASPSPSATPVEPTGTPRPTATPRPLPPTPEGLEPGWKLLTYDPFDGTGNAFPDFDLTVPPEAGRLTVTTRDGKSVWQASALQDYFGVGLTSTAGEFGDFYLSVSARQTSGPVLCEYGVNFRDSDSGGYLFQIQERARTFGLQYTSRDGQNRVFHLKQFSSAILAEGPNVLAIKAVGNAIMLFVNGQQIASVEDGGSLRGEIGLRVFVQQKGKEADFEFDDFQVYGP